MQEKKLRVALVLDRFYLNRTIAKKQSGEGVAAAAGDIVDQRSQTTNDVVFARCHRRCVRLNACTLNG